MFFQFRSNAKTPAVFRGLSFLTSADPRKPNRGKNKESDKSGGAGVPTGTTVTGNSVDGYMSFNSNLYKAGEELNLQKTARRVLTKMPFERTREDKQEALNMLKSHIRGFSNYPIRFQQMLINFGIYAQLGASRVLIKQGRQLTNH